MSFWREDSPFLKGESSRSLMVNENIRIDKNGVLWLLVISLVITIFELVTKPTGHGLVMTRLVTKGHKTPFLSILMFSFTLKKGDVPFIHPFSAQTTL